MLQTRSSSSINADDTWATLSLLDQCVLANDMQPSTHGSRICTRNVFHALLT